jgi:AcrR family transcriptional regulator
LIYHKAMKNITNNIGMPKKKGRPRSEKSRQAVLEATLALVGECGCGRGVTIEAIAKRAGVGKQTIYKWWKGTGGIFLEILREHAAREVDELSGEHDLETFLSYTFEALTPPVRLILKALMVEALSDEEIRATFVSEFIVQRRLALSEALGRSKGRIIDDKTILTDLVFGLMWYRLLLNVGPLDAREGRKIAKALMENK